MTAFERLILHLRFIRTPMDTLARSTLIARSMRSLSGVLVASILSAYATPGSATPSEHTPSTAPEPTANVASSVTLSPFSDLDSISEGAIASDHQTTTDETDIDFDAAPEVDDDSNTPDVVEPDTPPAQEPPILRPFPVVPTAPVPLLSEPPADPLYEDDYVLGPQDQIQVDIFNVPEFSGDEGAHTLLVDGTANFPWIGNVSLEGLTLNQAADRLEQEYSPFINDPLITVRLTRPRAIRISVVGEVNRPGSYTLDPIERVVERVNNVDAAEGNNQWTSLVQAIQTAGGITQTANVRDIQIRRPTRAEEEQIISVSLWELLQTGDISQDITLRDGDTIFVPTAVALDPNESIEVAAANFSPDVINTYVVGEVKEPGVLELRPNSTLNQAILAAGGFEDNRAGRVELIRLNPDGTVEKRDIDVDFGADLDNETNPALRDRDIILVGRSSGAQITDFLDNIFSPVADVLDTVLGVFPLLDLFDDDD